MMTPMGMLELGKECGLKHLDEAYGNVMRHYDAFFIIKSTQMQDFQASVIGLGLTETVDGVCTLRDLTIEQAIDVINQNSFCQLGKNQV